MFSCKGMTPAGACPHTQLLAGHRFQSGSSFPLSQRPKPSSSFLGADGSCSIVSKISIRSALGSCMPPDCRWRTRAGAQAAQVRAGLQAAAATWRRQQQEHRRQRRKQWQQLQQLQQRGQQRSSASSTTRSSTSGSTSGGSSGAAPAGQQQQQQRQRQRQSTLVGMPRMGASRRRTPSMVPRRMRFSAMRSCMRGRHRMGVWAYLHNTAACIAKTELQCSEWAAPACLAGARRAPVLPGARAGPGPGAAGPSRRHHTRPHSPAACGRTQGKRRGIRGRVGKRA